MSTGNGDGITDRIRRYDAHSSVLDEFRIRTTQGAFLSTITVIAIGYLINTELNFNLTPTITDRVHVNATTPTGLQVEFDVTFPEIACALLSVDAADPTGQAQSLHIDRTHRVWKHRLDSEGQEIGRRSRFELGDTMKHEDDVRELVKEVKPHLMEVTDENGKAVDMEKAMEKEEASKPKVVDDSSGNEVECGSCFGAGDDGECCNTCDDVKRAYRRKGWHISDLDNISVCREAVRSAQEKDEGCNIHGIVALSTGGGNFHIAPGRSLENFGEEDKMTLGDIILGAFEQFNVSHTVNKLHFGTDFPGKTNQLDGADRNVEDAYVMYQYYMQIVPTVYKYLNGTEIHTNQFSVTEHMRHVTPGSGRGLPGVFFYYEVSALHVVFEETRLGWIRFFTSVCAVVGGVFTVMGVLDRNIYERTKGKPVNLTPRKTPTSGTPR